MTEHPYCELSWFDTNEGEERRCVLKTQKLAKKQWRRGVHDNRRRLLDIQSRHPGGYFRRPKKGSFLQRDRKCRPAEFEGRMTVTERLSDKSRSTVLG